MKIKALIVLVAFFFSASLPLKITIHYDLYSKTTSLLTLNVCHAAGTALSAQADVPCVLQCSCALPVFEISVKHSVVNSVFNPYLSAFQLERPPKA